MELDIFMKVRCNWLISYLQKVNGGMGTRKWVSAGGGKLNSGFLKKKTKDLKAKSLYPPVTSNLFCLSSNVCQYRVEALPVWFDIIYGYRRYI